MPKREPLDWEYLEQDLHDAGVSPGEIQAGARELLAQARGHQLAETRKQLGGSLTIRPGPHPPQQLSDARRRLVRRALPKTRECRLGWHRTGRSAARQQEADHAGRRAENLPMLAVLAASTRLGRVVMLAGAVL
jgi:hypothetical protein